MQMLSLSSLPYERRRFVTSDDHCLVVFACEVGDRRETVDGVSRDVRAAVESRLVDVIAPADMSARALLDLCVREVAALYNCRVSDVRAGRLVAGYYSDAE